MKISQMSLLVMGSAWRNLTFMKLTTDEGLTGVSEVRLSNQSSRTFRSLATRREAST